MLTLIMEQKTFKLQNMQQIIVKKPALTGKWENK